MQRPPFHMYSRVSITKLVWALGISSWTAWTISWALFPSSRRAQARMMMRLMLLVSSRVSMG